MIENFYIFLLMVVVIVLFILFNVFIVDYVNNHKNIKQRSERSLINEFGELEVKTFKKDVRFSNNNIEEGKILMRLCNKICRLKNCSDFKFISYSKNDTENSKYSIIVNDILIVIHEGTRFDEDTTYFEDVKMEDTRGRGTNYGSHTFTQVTRRGKFSMQVFKLDSKEITVKQFFMEDWFFTGSFSKQYEYMDTRSYKLLADSGTVLTPMERDFLSDRDKSKNIYERSFFTWDKFDIGLKTKNKKLIQKIYKTFEYVKSLD